MSNGSAGTKHNNLDHPRLLKLFDWLRCHEEGLTEGKLTYVQWAQQATKELGFLVTPANVVSTCEAGNVKIKSSLLEAKKKARTALEKAIAEQLERALAAERAKVNSLEADLAALRKAVAHLYDKLGEKAPPYSGLVSLGNPQKTQIVERH